MSMYCIVRKFFTYCKNNESGKKSKEIVKILWNLFQNLEWNKKKSQIPLFQVFRVGMK